MLFDTISHLLVLFGLFNFAGHGEAGEGVQSPARGRYSRDAGAPPAPPGVQHLAQQAVQAQRGGGVRHCSGSGGEGPPSAPLRPRQGREQGPPPDTQRRPSISLHLVAPRGQVWSPHALAQPLQRRWPGLVEGLLGGQREKGGRAGRGRQALPRLQERLPRTLFQIVLCETCQCWSGSRRTGRRAEESLWRHLRQGAE